MILEDQGRSARIVTAEGAGFIARPHRTAESVKPWNHTEPSRPDRRRAIACPRLAMDEGRALLRARMSVRRNELDAKQRIAAAAGVLHSLETLPEFMTDANVAGYWAVRGELPLNLAVGSLRRRRQHYFLPVLGQAHQLHFAEYAEGTAVDSNRHGIPEPAVPPAALHGAEAMDVILLPLLAFDRHGHRLGTGGGWYDRSLAFLNRGARPASPLLVGIGYAFQQTESVPVAEWDVDLDYIATDAGLITCHPPTADG